MRVFLPLFAPLFTSYASPVNALHSGHLLDVNLKWNALKANGGRAVSKGLESNQVRARTCRALWKGGTRTCVAGLRSIAAPRLFSVLSVVVRQVLNKIDLGWNGMGDDGMKVRSHRRLLRTTALRTQRSALPLAARFLRWGGHLIELDMARLRHARFDAGKAGGCRDAQAERRADAPRRVAQSRQPCRLP